MLFDTSALDGRRSYKLLTATVVPRPIAWVVSVVAIDRNANIVVAEVLAVHVADAAVIDAAKCTIDTARLMRIGRMQSPGGYTRTRDGFSVRQLDFGEWQSTRDNAATPNEP